MNDLISRLRTRADIRRNAKGRKSVEEGKPDRLALLLDEAAEALEKSKEVVLVYNDYTSDVGSTMYGLFATQKLADEYINVGMIEDYGEEPECYESIDTQTMRISHG